MIPHDEALLLQLAAFAGNEPVESFLEIRCLYQGGRLGPREFFPVRGLREIITRAKSFRYRGCNVYIGAAPRVRENGSERDVERCWTLWADCDSEEAVQKLREFRPLPAIVARTSPGRLQALWPLRRSLEPDWARRANRRLAFHLGSDMAATDPARILRAIGTYNHKHQPPVIASCARAECEVFEVRDVVGELPDVPVPERKPYTGPPSSPKAIDALVRVVREVPRGERNHALFWAACADCENGNGARETLRQAGLDAGLPEWEVERTLDSAANRVLGG